MQAKHQSVASVSFQTEPRHIKFMKRKISKKYYLLRSKENMFSEPSSFTLIMFVCDFIMLQRGVKKLMATVLNIIKANL